MAEHHPQFGQHMQQRPIEAFKNDRNAGPSTSKVLASITLFPLGGFCLLLADITLTGTLIGLAVVTPGFTIFSHVLVPATLTIGLVVTGFMIKSDLTSGLAFPLSETKGDRKLSFFAWYTYLKRFFANLESADPTQPHFDPPMDLSNLDRGNVELGNKHMEAGLEENTISLKAIPNAQTTLQHKLLPPFVSALKDSAKQKVATFHFPGHNRGRAAPPSLSNLIGYKPFLHDSPELPELNNLFAPEGPILDAQKQAAKLFGAKETWFLVGGTTCGIQAAIMATCSPGDTLILPRNCHISAISGMILSGVLPKYIFPEYDSDWDISTSTSPSQLEKAIKELGIEGRNASAVFITYPTYHGYVATCQLFHSYSIPVIVDEAHGAHLGFHRNLPSSALSQGADISVQSTHKVLCSLTQSSMLHLSGNLVDRERICKCLQTLQSTSPSYLLLASLDAARDQLSQNQEIIFDKAIELAFKARTFVSEIPGISVLDYPRFIDPLRITVGVWKLGLSGFEADRILYENYDVVSELKGTRSITFAVNLGSSKEDIQRLVAGFKYLSNTYFTHSKEEKLEGVKCFVPFEGISTSLGPREAFFARKRKVGIEESVGEICGELICPYPPGIPLLIPGEVITEVALNYLLQVKNEGAMISGAADPNMSSIVVCNFKADFGSFDSKMVVKGF